MFSLSVFNSFKSIIWATKLNSSSEASFLIKLFSFSLILRRSFFMTHFQFLKPRL